MQKHKTALTIAAILFAVSLPLLSAVKADRDQKKWPVIRFSIEPYDPRDLLYGHYMRFQIRWNWKQGAPLMGGRAAKACLCVGEGDTDPEVRAMPCPSAGEKPAECAHIITGQYRSWTSHPNQELHQIFTTDINRYYVDESMARPLEKLFFDKREEFSIGLGLPPQGKPVMEKMYVGGVAVDEYIVKNKDALLSKTPPPWKEPPFKIRTPPNENNR